MPDEHDKEYWREKYAPKKHSKTYLKRKYKPKRHSQEYYVRKYVFGQDVKTPMEEIRQKRKRNQNRTEQISGTTWTNREKS